MWRIAWMSPSKKPCPWWWGFWWWGWPFHSLSRTPRRRLTPATGSAPGFSRIASPPSQTGPAGRSRFGWNYGVGRRGRRPPSWPPAREWPWPHPLLQKLPVSWSWSWGRCAGYCWNKKQENELPPWIESLFSIVEVEKWGEKCLDTLEEKKNKKGRNKVSASRYKLRSA